MFKKLLILKKQFRDFFQTLQLTSTLNTTSSGKRKKFQKNSLILKKTICNFFGNFIIFKTPQTDFYKFYS